MFRTRMLAIAFCTAVGSSQAKAEIITVDLSGATTGTLITAPGASFAQAFAGQTVSGINLVGAPSNPLSLSPSGSITVAFFDPGVSPASNSLLSQPGNTAPLAVLLAQNADSLTFTAGSAQPPSSITLSFYGADGSLVNSVVQPLSNNYAIYSFSGLGTFRGFSVSGNNDLAGLRFQNISYNAVAGAEVPEPLTLASLGVMVIAGGLVRRRNLSRKLTG